MAPIEPPFERRGLLLLLLLTLGIALAPAHAQQITPTLKACMTVRDGPERLVCYDREMKRIEAAAASIAARPSDRANPAASPAASPQERFGHSPDAVREPRIPSRIEARVATAAREASGRYLITLDNGQVWLQTEDQLGFAPRAGTSVSIKRGLLGAYWMSDRYYVVGVRRLR